MFNTPYCNITCADNYLEDSDVWNSASDEDKEKALSFGRAYIDSKYSCVSFDEDNPPDQIKYANALLAEDYLEGTLIQTAGAVSGSVKSERSKAGSVETETKYFGSRVAKAQDDVDLVLADICKKVGASVRMIYRV